jgi:hypothetical protein
MFFLIFEVVGWTEAIKSREQQQTTQDIKNLYHICIHHLNIINTMVISIHPARTATSTHPQKDTVCAYKPAAVIDLQLTIQTAQDHKFTRFLNLKTLQTF